MAATTYAELVESLARVSGATTTEIEADVEARRKFDALSAEAEELDAVCLHRELATRTARLKETAVEAQTAEGKRRAAQVEVTNSNLSESRSAKFAKTAETAGNTLRDLALEQRKLGRETAALNAQIERQRAIGRELKELRRDMPHVFIEETGNVRT